MQRAQAAKEREQRIRKEETEKAQAEERAAMQREVEEKKASATTLAHQLQNSIDEQE
jgi:ribosomal protein L34E